MKERVDTLLISLETLNQVLPEAVHTVREDADAVQKVADHKRFVNVQLELTVHAADSGSDVVAHNLGAHHGQRLALGRVNLARHDRGTRLVLGQDQLAQTAARSGSEVADVLGDLEERAGKSVQGARGLNDRVVGSKDLELVGSSLELGTSQFGDLLSDSLVEALEGVQTGTHCGTTLSKKAEVGKRALNALNVAVKLGNVARELLAEGKRGSILQVGTTNLDNRAKLLHLLLQGIAEVLQRGKQGALDLKNSSNVHNGGEGVV